MPREPDIDHAINEWVARLRAEPQAAPPVGRRQRFVMPNLNVNFNVAAEIPAPLDAPQPRFVDEEDIDLNDAEMVALERMERAARKAKAMPVKPDERLNKPEKSTRINRFRPKYENWEECRLRLRDSIVTLYDTYVYVMDVNMARDSDTNEYGTCAVAYDQTGVNKYYLLHDHGMNLRSIDPGYVEIPDLGVYWIYRIPARVYKQGNNRENTRMRKPGQVNGGYLSRDHIRAILRGLENRTVNQFSQATLDHHIQMYDDFGNNQGYRLSDAVCIYITAKRYGSKRFKVEYKGRELGYIKEGIVYLDTSDYHHPWVGRALDRVGLKYALEE